MTPSVPSGPRRRPGRWSLNSPGPSPCRPRYPTSEPFTSVQYTRYSYDSVVQTVSSSSRRMPMSSLKGTNDSACGAKEMSLPGCSAPPHETTKRTHASASDENRDSLFLCTRVIARSLSGPAERPRPHAGPWIRLATSCNPLPFACSRSCIRRRMRILARSRHAPRHAAPFPWQAARGSLALPGLAGRPAGWIRKPSRRICS